jgi:hypothetical protein
VGGIKAHVRGRSKPRPQHTWSSRLLVLVVGSLIGAGGAPGANGQRALEPWDLPFYMGLAKEQAAGKGSRKPADNAPWEAAQHFEVSACVGGLATLCEALFGVTVTLGPVPAAEAWWGMGEGLGEGNGKVLQGVSRLELSHAEHGPLGVVYVHKPHCPFVCSHPCLAHHCPCLALHVLALPSMSLP